MSAGGALVRMPEPWSPGQATERIREMASHPAFGVHYKVHAKDQMNERRLLVGDVLHVLKHGFVYGAPVPATRNGLYKYAMECTTPNSASRSVRVIVIPHYKSCEAKIVTVMWADEPMVGR